MTWNPAMRLLTIDEAARSIDRPASTVRRWISEGRLIPHARLGKRRLYLEADVLRLEADLCARLPRPVSGLRDNAMEHPRDAGTSEGLTD